MERRKECIFKRIIYLFIYFTMLLIDSAANAQNSIAVKLEKKYQDKPSNVLYFVHELYLYSPSSKYVFDSLLVFKGIPNNLIEKVIKYIDFQPEQGIFEYYLKNANPISRDSLLGVLSNNLNNINDTANLYRGKIKHYLFFLIGTNPDGKRVIIVDANNNLDFSDDQTIELDKLTKVKARPFVNANIEYCYDKQVYGKLVSLSINPFDSYKEYATDIENKFSVSIYSHECKSGQVHLGKDLVQINLFFTTSYLIDPIDSWKIHFTILSNANHSSSPQLDYSIKDTVLISDKCYVISDLSRFADTITLTPINGESKPDGIDVGAKAIPISGKDFITNGQVKTSDYKGKYILLDFWGSWCGSCIAAIPSLVNLYARYHNKLQIVSVASDPFSNLPILKGIIKKYGMTWNHLIDIDDAVETIHIKYHVGAYPTFILIDPSGKIIRRVEGDKIEEMRNDIL